MCVLADCHHRFLHVNPVLAFFFSTEGGSPFDVSNIELMSCEPVKFRNGIRIIILVAVCRSPVSFLLVFEFLRLFFSKNDGQGASVFKGEGSFHEWKVIRWRRDGEASFRSVVRDRENSRSIYLMSLKE